MRRGLTLLLLSLAILSIVAAGGTAEVEQTPSCTIFVQPGQPIQAAIDEAPPGAVICLPAGEWQEHLTIGKSLTLRGEGATSTLIRGIQEDGPVIRAYGTEETEPTIVLAGLSAISRLQGRGDAVVIEGRVVAKITDCVISGQASGLVLSGSVRATVFRCTISGYSYGIWGDIGFSVVVASCKVTAGLWGIMLVLEDLGAAGVIDSTVSADSVGLLFLGSGETIVTGCLISGDSLSSVLLGGAGQTSIMDCFITKGYGSAVSIQESPCTSAVGEFTGYIAGSGNVVLNPSQPRGSRPEVCPDTLSFLMTEEGGELDRRK